MAALARVRVALTGWSGAPGCNTLYFSPGTTGAWTPSLADNLYAEVRSMLEANASMYVAGVSMEVEADIAVIDPPTGDITEMIVADDSEGPVAGSGTGGHIPRGTAVVAALKTGVWRNGRQLQGRLFLGPVQQLALDGNGLVATQVRTDVANSFQAMISGVGPRLAVYSRPNTTTGRGGYYEDVVNVVTNSKPGSLRSRRD